MTVSTTLKATAKATVRAALRKAGYEIAPRSTSFVALQRRLLASSDLVVDVGANVGQYAELVRSLGYCGRLISFEPQREAFDVLGQRSRGVPSWEVRRLGLAAHDGVGTLKISANSVSSSLLDVLDRHVSAAPRSATVGVEDIRLSTLDKELTGQAGTAVWVKLDVQGTELDVLQGGRETLERAHVVQSELSLSALYEEQTDYLELCAFLRRTGLHLCHLQPGFQDPVSGRLLQVDALFARQ